MKNLYGNKVTQQKKYYVPQKSSFSGIVKVLNHLPSFNSLFQERVKFSTCYYDTPDGFLKKMGVIVSLTEYADKKIVLLEYLTNLIDKNKVNKTYELELAKDEDILSHKARLFVEDRLEVIFGTKLQIDMLHILKNLTAEYKIEVDREIFKVDHNTGFVALAYMDEVVYINVKQRRKYKDKIFEISMVSADTDFNKGLFERVINYILAKNILIEMEETRLEAIKLFTKFK